MSEPCAICGKPEEWHTVRDIASGLPIMGHEFTYSVAYQTVDAILAAIKRLRVEEYVDFRRRFKKLHEGLS